MNQLIFVLFELVVLLFSVMAHEIAHGVVANKLGDPTAKLAGRLNFNPLKHLDPVGSFLVPLLLFVSTGGSMVFGWAKPVPYNPMNLKNPKTGAGLIAAAGPLTNFLIAICFGIILRILLALSLTPASPLFFFLNIIIQLNLLLALFNLVPIPPLDGSGILFTFLPAKFYSLRTWLERYGTVLLIIFILFGFGLLQPVVNFLFSFIGR